jgi:hypothetical protein
MSGDAQPAPKFATYTPAQLLASLAEADAHAQAAKQIKAEVESALRFRYSLQLSNAKAQANGNTAHVDLPDGFKLTAETKNDVKWDSARLLAIAETMAWPTVKQMFKIELSMGAETYRAVSLADPELGKRLQEARTVTPKDQPLKLVRVEG